MIFVSNYCESYCDQRKVKSYIRQMQLEMFNKKFSFGTV
jgi:hypothetical protein